MHVPYTGSIRNDLVIKRQLASRFWCVIITPFGLPVEPEVYWINPRSSGLRLGLTQSSAYCESIASVANHGIRCKPGESFTKSSQRLMMVCVVSATAASASMEIELIRFMLRLRRGG